MKGVVLVLGPERFLAREAVERAVEGRPEVDITRLDGAATPLAQALDEVRTRSLLGGARTVIVENAGEMLRTALEAIAAYAGRPAPGALLILVAPSLDGRLKGAKQLRDAAQVVECQPPRGWEVTSWIRERAKRAYGLQTGDLAAGTLRRVLGDDLGLLDVALRRLRDQIAPRIFLRPEDIAGSTEERRSPAIFEASNALEEADLPGALQALASAFDGGIRIDQDVVAEEGAIAAILLDSLHKSYVRLIRYHLHRKVGASEEDAGRRAGCSPNALRFFLPKANRHQLDALVERHRHFREADFSLKENGPADGRRVLETLVLALLA